MSDFHPLTEDYVNKYNYQFENPIKDSRNVYVAKLKKPMKILLPHSEILEIYQDELGINNFKYLISADDIDDFLNALYKLDEFAIKFSESNSKKWFGKELKSAILEKYYTTPYNTEEIEDGEVVYLDIIIENMDIIDDIIKLNEGVEKSLEVELEGIRFFKKSFTYQFVLKRLVGEDDFNFVEAIASQGGNSIDDNSIDNDSKVNDSKIMNYSSNITPSRTIEPVRVEPVKAEPSKVESVKVEPVRVEEVEQVKKVGLESIKMEKKFDTELIDSLADVVKESPRLEITTEKQIKGILKKEPVKEPVKEIIKEVIKESSSIRTTESGLSRIEVQSRLEEKRKEARTHFLNAERATRAAEALRLKATQASQEAREWEKTLIELDSLEK